MKGLGGFRMGALLAALAAPLGQLDAKVGKNALDEVFSGGPGMGMNYGGGRNAKHGKHRCSGTTSPRPNSTTDWRGAPGHKEAAKRLARGEAGDDREWRKRMEWNARVYPRVLAHQDRQRVACK